ncbi:MAG: nucleotidyltransferase family protein [Candidatus Tantalella remota]|nr:nucleotidyltransferase family protein [Candidatus Tantalella remota]
MTGYYPALVHGITDLTPEERLVISLARIEMSQGNRQEALAFIKSGINWKNFLKVVDLYQSGPLVYRNIQPFENVPEHVLSSLRGETARVFAGNTLILRCAGRISEVFSENGIKVLFMKGLPFMMDVYNDAAFRIFSDVDILTDDMEAVDRVLKENGYAPCDDTNDDSAYRAQCLYSDGKGMYLDVHADLTGRRMHSRMSGLTMEELWPARREVSFAGVNVYTLGIEHTLLYHCLHLATQHSFGDLRWYVDINEFVREHSGRIDWGRLVSLAGKYRIKRPVYYSLLFAVNIFGTLVPEDVLNRLGTVKRGLDKWLFKKIRENEGSIDYFTELFMFDTVGDTGKFIFLNVTEHPHLAGHFFKISAKALRSVFSFRRENLG